MTNRKFESNNQSPTFTIPFSNYIMHKCKILQTATITKYFNQHHRELDQVVQLRMHVTLTCRFRIDDNHFVDSFHQINLLKHFDFILKLCWYRLTNFIRRNMLLQMQTISVHDSWQMLTKLRLLSNTTIKYWMSKQFQRT
jgi:hypothetical protein